MPDRNPEELESALVELAQLLSAAEDWEDQIAVVESLDCLPEEGLIYLEAGMVVDLDHVPRETSLVDCSELNHHLGYHEKNLDESAVPEDLDCRPGMVDSGQVLDARDRDHRICPQQDGYDNIPEEAVGIGLVADGSHQ